MKIIGIFQLFFQSFKKPAAKGKKGGAADTEVAEQGAFLFINLKCKSF